MGEAYKADKNETHNVIALASQTGRELQDYLYIKLVKRFGTELFSGLKSKTDISKIDEPTLKEVRKIIHDFLMRKDIDLDPSINKKELYDMMRSTIQISANDPKGILARLILYVWQA